MVKVTVETQTDEASITVQYNRVEIHFSGGFTTELSIIQWGELNAAIERAVAAYDAAMEYAPDEATP